MNKKQLGIKILLVLSLGTIPVYAADMPSYDMEEIIVTADASSTTVTGETVNVKYMSPGKAATIPELLRQSTGIDIQSRSIAGDNQDGTVKLRGFDARRFTVMLNGRQINSAGVMGGQYVDWTTIPLNTVEKIQIIKGGKLASQGNTIGGVINIITRDKGPSGGEINLLSGENGRYDYLFQYAGSADKLYFEILANKTGADAFLRNNDYDAEQYGLRLNYKASDKDSFRFGVNKTDARRGFIVANTLASYDPRYPLSSGEILSPGGGSWAAAKPGSYWEKKNTYYDFSYKREQKNGYWQLDYYKNDETRREVNTDASGAVVLDRTIPSDKSDYVGLSGKQTIQGHTFGYGADYKRLRYGYGWYDVNTVNAGAIYPSQKVDLFGMYVDDSWQLNKRWAAYMGLRYDDFSGSKGASQVMNIKDTNYSSLSPKLNLSFKNNKDTTTYLSVNRLWRAPSMAEYYWWSNNYNSSTVNGKVNPSYHTDLKPEQGMSYEVGTEHRFSDHYTSKMTFYYQDIKDYLNFQHTSPFFAYNIDHVKVWGAEWENSIKLNNVSKVFLNYTNQHTQKVGVAASDTLGLQGELDYRPRHKVALSYLYDAKPWQVRYTANFVSSQLDGYTSGTTFRLGSYTVHNVAVTKQLDEDRAVSLYIDNLFDKKYVEQYNYPLPGRLFSVSFKQKI